MAEQQSLFGNLPGFAPEPAAAGKPAGKRRALLDPDTLPVPEKLGPQRVRFGTSSWTYPGWNGLVYRDVSAYGSETRFSQHSLGEYARDRRFRTAGADNLYYVPPRQRLKMLQRFREQLDRVPGFDLCPKVWHGVTVNRYTKLQQEKWRMTTEINRDFLDPEVFLAEVAQPLEEALGEHLGPLIFEIQENDIHPTEFAGLLDRFFAGLRGRTACRICVELRTLDHFTPRYLDVLGAHGAGHVLNSWTRMPPIGWQHARLLAHGYPGQAVLVRALLSPGQFVAGHLQPGSSYDEAVEAYQPYDKIVHRLPDVRDDIRRVVTEAPQETPVYVLVNNRLEGHAPQTIGELIETLWGLGFPSAASRDIQPDLG